MNLYTLDDIINFSLNEEQLDKTISQQELNSSNFRKIGNEKIINSKTGLSLQIYVKVPHFDDRFEERFITGQGWCNNKNQSFKIKFCDLPNWKPRDIKYFNTKLVQGINKIITDYKLKNGGYHIFSESSRMIIPVAILNINNENKKAAIISSVFHSSMTNLDVFKWRNQSFNKQDVMIEYRSWKDFIYVAINEQISNIDYLNIELFHENEDIYTNTPIIVLK